jgi:hypothetical protein
MGLNQIISQRCYSKLVGGQNNPGLVRTHGWMPALPHPLWSSPPVYMEFAEEDTMLNEVSQAQKHKGCMFFLIRGRSKDKHTHTKQAW